MSKDPFKKVLQQEQQALKQDLLHDFPVERIPERIDWLAKYIALSGGYMLRQPSGKQTLGANQHAALTAGDMGMNQDRSLTMAHSGDGTKAAYDSTSKQVNDLRETGNVDGYDTEDRQRQKDARNS